MILRSRRALALLSSAATLAAGIVGTVASASAHAATPAAPYAGLLAFRTVTDQAALINGDGTDARPIPDTINADSPLGWSPDGSRLVTDGGGSVFTTRPDGSSQYFLAGGVGGADNPSYALAGRTVLSDIGGRLYFQASDGGQVPTRLLSNAQEPSDVSDQQPVGSPQGLIAFSRQDAATGDTGIWTLNPNTNAVAETLPNATGPVFSANGSTLLFTRQVGNEPQVFSAKPNGTNVTQLTDDPQGADEPSLSPDGSTLAYNTYDPSTGQQVIRTLSLTTPGATPVFLFNGSEPSWQPLQLNGIDHIYGVGAVSTSVAASHWDYDAVGKRTIGLVEAYNAVLMNSSDSGDAPAAVALAAEKQAPLLTTSGSSLTAATAAELRRTLPRGWTVYLEGSTSELSARVAAQVQALGYRVARMGATDPTDESVLTARAITSAPTWIVIADDMDYRTALSAASAAGAGGYHGRFVVLLNGSWSLPRAIANYMNALNPATRLLAVGSRSIYALENSRNLTKEWHFWTLGGSNGEQLANSLAEFWWGAPAEATVENSSGWQDGAAAAAAAATYGPLLWTSPKYLSPDTLAYLERDSASIGDVQMFGTAGFPGNTIAETKAAIAFTSLWTELYNVPDGNPTALPANRTAATSLPAAAIAGAAVAEAPATDLGAPQAGTARG